MPTSPEETHDIRKIRQAMAEAKAVRDTEVVPRTDASRTDDGDACLVHIYPVGPSLGLRYPIRNEPITIGREPACAVQITDGSVSRRHATIRPDREGGHRLEDAGSSNGTYLNDARVISRRLKDGDYLRVGPNIYRYLRGGNVEADYHEEVRRLAVLDPLTGTHNRRSLNECLVREVERAKRYARPLAVALFDIDHFKSINDRVGHLGGDLTLKEVAARLTRLTRREEFVARYGGEEFVAVLPETDLGGAVVYGERVRRAVADAPFGFEKETYSVTISCGVGVIRPDDDVSVPDLLQRADERLYEAKRSGRNRVCPAARISPGRGSAVTPQPDPRPASAE